jgi:hypothetical protein
MPNKKTQVIELKRVILLDRQKARKKGDSFFALFCQDIIENTGRGSIPLPRLPRYT